MATRLAEQGVVVVPGAAQALERTLQTGTDVNRCCPTRVLLRVHVYVSPPSELIRLSGAGILRRVVQLLNPINSLGACARVYDCFGHLCARLGLKERRV